MADLRISELPPLVGTDLQADDDLPITDYSASETRRLTAKNLVQNGVSRLIDNGTMPGEKIQAYTLTELQLADKAVTERTIDTSAVTADKIDSGAVTEQKYASASIPTRAFQAGAVDTNALADGSVTAEKLAPDSLDGANLQAGTVGQVALAKPSVGTPEIFDGAVDSTKLAGDAVKAENIAPGAVGTEEIADGSITTDKYASGSVTGAAIADGTLQSVHFAAGAVDNSALAPDSVTGDKIAPNTIVDGDIQLNTIQADKIASVDGAVIVDDSVQATSLGTVTDRGIDQVSGLIGHANEILAGTKFGIQYDEFGHIVGASSTLDSTDLPPATDVSLGGVSVPSGGGLSVSGAGALVHSNSVTGRTVSGITFDDQGHVTGAVPLSPSELPIANNTDVGGVSVPVGQGLSIDGTGALRHTSSGVAPGTYPKVTVNAAGHVTEGEGLEDSDIPNIPADKIVGGTFDTTLIGAETITRDMIADYAIAYIQEAIPTSVDPGHIGCLWFQESTAQLRMWNGNSWNPVGFGRLSQDNLRWGGLFDAATGLITQVTENGQTAGAKIGEPIPVATDALGGLYFLCEVAGDNVTVTPGVVYNVADWCLCINEADGWELVDTAAGGAGGSGVPIRLTELVDVNCPAPADAEFLKFDSVSGNWVNADLIDCGTF